MTAINPFTPLERERPLGDRIAGLLTEAIATSELKPGEQLPTAQALADQFAVSRTVIREAVRALVAKDLVRVEGRRLFVSQVSSSAVTDSMTLFLRGRDSIDYARIHEVRLPLEIQIAGLAAERATAEDLDGLRAICEELPVAIGDGDIEAAAHADVSFHRRLAELTHNELFPMLLDAMSDVMLETRRASFVLPARQQAAPQEHRRILDEVASRDSNGAQAAMRDHLRDSEATWRTVSQ